MRPLWVADTFLWHPFTFYSGWRLSLHCPGNCLRSKRFFQEPNFFLRGAWWFLSQGLPIPDLPGHFHQSDSAILFCQCGKPMAGGPSPVFAKKPLSPRWQCHWNALQRYWRWTGHGVAGTGIQGSLAHMGIAIFILGSFYIHLLFFNTLSHSYDYPTGHGKWADEFSTFDRAQNDAKCAWPKKAVFFLWE